MRIEFTLNGQRTSVDVPSDISLLKLLRDVLNLTGVKCGCEIGECGACSVLLDGRLVNSCLVLAGQVGGRQVVTIEGLRAADGGPNDLQQAFIDCGAVQCGYCTPGMVLAGEALLARTLTPTRQEIRAAIAGNLCRCTGYQQIVDAIEATAKLRREGERERRRQEDKETEEQGLNVVGKPARRVDAVEKVTGAARYVGDMRVPGMLVARVLRSGIPHGKITKLDVTPALIVPGVVAAITCEDFADHGNYGFPVKDDYMLAFQKVRYEGDAIAAVAAQDEQAAEAGLRAIVCQVEELPGVFSIKEALAPDAPAIGPEGNLCTTQIVRNGDPAPILAACAVTLDETYTTPHQEHAYLETEGALAIPQPGGGLLVYANCQSPFIARSTLAAVLGLPIEQVRVIQPHVGGAFGGKDDVIYECAAQAAALALKANRPVLLTLGRQESIVASYKRDAMKIHIRLGAAEDGSLQAAQIEAHVDSGAYASMTPFSTWRAAMHMAGAYRYQAARVDAHVVYTNNGYCGAFRGFGNAQAVACIEQAIDELAERCGVDPIEFRLNNCLRSGDRAMTGQTLEQEVPLAECLRWVRDKSDWVYKRRNQVSSRNLVSKGIGVACYFHGCSLGGEGADYATSTLCVNDDDTLTLTSGLTDYGQGSRTVFTLIAAETLGLNPERITMLRPDTDTAVDSGPTVASRSTILGGNATRIAAERLAGLLDQAAADALGCDVSQVVRDGKRYVGPNEEPLTFEQVAAHARVLGLTLSARGKWEMPHIEWHFDRGAGVPYYAYSFGAQVIEVAVDTATGKVNVTGVWAAHDGGQVIFPQGAYGQMYGGIAQGLGYGLLERVEFKRGRIQNANFDEYIIPTAMDVPEIQAAFIPTTFQQGPYGAKNMAEPPLLPVAPAIANAIYHATGRRIRHLPATLERVLLGRDLER